VRAQFLSNGKLANTKDTYYRAVNDGEQFCFAELF
jgi:hypothetical protein